MNEKIINMKLNKKSKMNNSKKKFKKINTKNLKNIILNLNISKYLKTFFIHYF